MRLAFALSFLLFFLLAGALGLRTVEECDSDPAVQRPSLKMQCYHTAAVTMAYLCGSGTNQPCGPAIAICRDIFQRFGSGENYQTGSDIAKRAELTSNNCFYDVAKITANFETCGYIQTQISLGTELLGAEVTRETCEDEVTRLADLAPENYYSNNPNNLCALVFVLPLLVLGAWRFN